MLVLFILFLPVLLVVNSHAFQTYLAQRITAYLSDKWKTEVSIDKVQIDFPNAVVFRGFVVKDQLSDTLISVNKLGFSMEYIDRSFAKIQLGKLEVNNAYLNLYSIDSTSYNLDFLTAILENESEDTSLFQLTVRNYDLHNLRFHFHDFNFSDSSENQIDYNHIEVSDLMLRGSDFKLINSEVDSRINHLSLHEKKGFHLDTLNADFKMNDCLMDFQHLNIITPYTKLKAHYSMEFKQFSDFGDFISKVKLKADFENSILAMSDLSYFVEELKGLTSRLTLNGLVVGTVDNISGRKVEIAIEDKLTFEGKFDLRGLPNIEETYMHLRLKNLTTDAEGLSSLPYPPFKEKNTLDVPDNFKELGQINFKGDFTGFYNDFVAYGSLHTALGTVKTDLLMSEAENGKFSYTGEVFSEEFRIGEFIDFKNLSRVGLSAHIQGSGISINEVEAKVDAKIQALTLNDYEYNDINVFGEISDRRFHGDLTLRDENLKLDFSGLIDLSQEEPISKFDISVIESKLSKLNLFHENDSMTELSFNARLDFKGIDVDKVKGSARFDSISYRDSKYKHVVDRVSVKASGKPTQRSIEVFSSIMDAQLEGQIYLEDLPNAILKYIEYYTPLKSSTRQFKAKQDFKFSFLLKDMTVLNDVLWPELKVDTNTEIYGIFNTENHLSELILSSGELGYGPIYFDHPDLKLNSSFDSLSLTFVSQALAFNRVHIDEVRFYSNLKNGKSKSQMTWGQQGQSKNKGQFNIDGFLYRLDSMEFSFFNSSFTLKNSLWNITEPNNIVLDTFSIALENLGLSNSSQAISLNGNVNNQDGDSLNLNLQNIQLAYLTALLPEGVLDLKGTANGFAHLKNAYHDLTLSSDLQIDQLEINDTYIGDSYIKSTWYPQKEAFKINAKLGDKNSEKFNLKGNLYPFKTENSLDLKLDFNHTPMELLKPYLTDYLSNVSGNLDGILTIHGEPYKPLIRGKLNLEKSGFKIDYLNTSYFIDDEIIIEPDFIGFNLIEIYDEQGAKAIGTGTIFHDNYHDFNMDIGLEFENFLSLNTNSTQNDLYYGKAIVSGTANIAGYADQMILEIDVTSKKGTSFNIPISDGVEVSGVNYLTFTNSHLQEEEKPELDLNGIQMNFDLKVDPETNVQIIFDEQVGDVMKATGEGNLKLEINTLGDFNIYGQYFVQKGDYLFTLQNIINKKFKIAEGSSISWDGDPYNAIININAIYNLRASLYDIMPEDSTTNTRRRVPVELELKLSEALLNPEINFDIRIPTAGEEVKRRLQSILYLNSSDVNKQEMNQQVFGLLMLNRFLPPSSGIANQDQVDRGTPGINNGYELLSNQLSNWLSKMSNQFDIGVNYRPGDEITNEELDLSLSTQVFNERLVLDGNLGYTNSNNVSDDQQNTNFIGEFSAEYKISRDGRFRLRGFNRSTNNNLLQNVSPYTQGIGLFYREEFDTFQELWRYYFKASNNEKKSD